MGPSEILWYFSGSMQIYCYWVAWVMVGYGQIKTNPWVPLPYLFQPPKFGLHWRELTWVFAHSLSVQKEKRIIYFPRVYFILCVCMLPYSGQSHKKKEWQSAREVLVSFPMQQESKCQSFHENRISVRDFSPILHRQRSVIQLGRDLSPKGSTPCIH